MTSFRIIAHGVPGVPGAPGEPSSMQRRLLTSEKPVRIVGAPTGAGKTWTFLLAAQEGRFVILVVPTRALARNVEAEAERMHVFVRCWDAIHGRELRERGLSVWDVRHEHIERMRSSGGILVTTPESLALVLYGQPQLERVPLTVADLASADHVVFDEAHTFNERGLGFLSFWMMLAAYRRLTHGAERPKLSLLSATHSNLWQAWFRQEGDESLRQEVESFDEELVSGGSGPVRWLHGDVDVTVEADGVLPLFFRHAGELAEGRTLIIYDSLRQMAMDLPELRRGLSQVGLSPEQVYVIDAQDQQVSQSLGSEDLPSGLSPRPEHRLIIGTSAIEMGVNYPELRYGFLESGRDAAALLQRIGRVARGPVSGRIWVAGTAEMSHVVKLEGFKGEVDIGTLRDRLQPLRELNLNRARALADAYFSFLEHQPGHLRDFITPAQAKLHPGAKTPGGSLNAIRAGIEHASDRHRIHLRRWMAGVDQELRELRDFAPTVLIRFADRPAVEYSRYWAERWLNLRYLHIDDDGTWNFPYPRDKCLTEEPNPVDLTVLHPFRGPRHFSLYPWDTRTVVDRLLSIDPGYLLPEDKKLWQVISNFTRATGLVVYDDMSHDPQPSAVI